MVESSTKKMYNMLLVEPSTNKIHSMLLVKPSANNMYNMLLVELSTNNMYQMKKMLHGRNVIFGIIVYEKRECFHNAIFSIIMKLTSKDER